MYVPTVFLLTVVFLSFSAFLVCWKMENVSGFQTQGHLNANNGPISSVMNKTIVALIEGQLGVYCCNYNSSLNMFSTTTSSNVPSSNASDGKASRSPIALWACSSTSAFSALNSSNFKFLHILVKQNFVLVSVYLDHVLIQLIKPVIGKTNVL